MFTGLVEAVGCVIQQEDLGEQARWGIRIPFSQELALGDSVAINGCCLTVAKLESDVVYFDLLKQTLDVTALQQLQVGSYCNLERALRVGDRLGGHFVQGHVDGVATLKSIESSGQDHILSIDLPAHLSALCIDKGSISIDGISLTIASLNASSITIWITPHTWENTHLKTLQVPQSVNIEVDMMAKYVARLLQKQ
jgi:riboflavin synthase